jgi:hypothetical protein
MRGAVRKIVAALRDGWLIVGLTLLLFVSLEILYRAQGAIRRGLQGEATPAAPPERLAVNHPNAGEAWWGEIYAQSGRVPEGRIRYDPFRGWWRLPQQSRYINVDAEGRRVTLQPPLAAGPRRLVYMFGGSVMWGWIVRDSFTIPALVATRLRSRGYADVEVVNFSQSMFDLAQNLATLVIELRRGRVPAVVVFLDGNNESAPAYQSGEQGRILNEARIALRFSRRSGLGPDLVALLRHSALVRRLTERTDSPSRVDRESLCDGIAASYAREVRAIEAIAGAFSFDPIFLWQPLLATTKKPLSEWEQRVSRPAEWGAMLRRCTTAADSLLAGRRGTTFFSLSDLFDGDSSSVFLDDYGHLTERANGVVADYIALRIAERLGPPK